MNTSTRNIESPRFWLKYAAFFLLLGLIATPVYNGWSGVTTHLLDHWLVFESASMIASLFFVPDILMHGLTSNQE